MPNSAVTQPDSSTNGPSQATPRSSRIIAAGLVVVMAVTLGQGLGLIGLPAAGLTEAVAEAHYNSNPWYLTVPNWLK